MNYTLNSQRIKFKKIDRDSATLLLLDDATHLVINDTGNEILEYLPLFNTTDELIEKMLCEYPDIQRKEIARDVIELLNILEVYDILNMESKREKTQSEQYIITGDLYYKSISKYIIDSLDDDSTKYFQEGAKEYYSPIALRFRVINNHEYSVFVEKLGEIQSYLSISGFQQTISKTININEVFMKKDLNDEEEKKYFVGMLDKIIDVLCRKKEISKIRIGLLNHSQHDKMRRLIKQSGFEHECTLKDETIAGDVDYFAYHVKR